jgi:hypothetical protein
MECNTLGAPDAIDRNDHRHPGPATQIWSILTAFSAYPAWNPFIIVQLEQRDVACRFHHNERFSGILLPLFGDRLLQSTREGFEAMNAALKKRAEAD